MSIHEISFASANGRDTIKGWIYTPLARPHAVVQLIHGFGEHSRRYLHMIDCFTEAGYIVCADDHLGHGKTGYDSKTLGDPGTKGEDGWLDYLKDEKSLHDLTCKLYPNLPYFVFGHSWGSMLARGYAALYGQDLKGLLLCGVVSQMKGCELALQSIAPMRAEIAAGHGPEKGMEWMVELFAGMTDRIENPNSPNDWIANDPRVVADHAGDPFNCFDPTKQLMFDFLKLYESIEADDWAAKLPRDLPVYLTGGDHDPCGHYGEGIYHVANLLADTGHPIRVKVYGGFRHEVHNQREIRADVEESLVNFIGDCLE